MATPRHPVGTVVVVAALFSWSVPRAEGETRPIVLHVVNYAGVAAGTLASAQKRAAAIYAAAGFRTVWVAGDTDTASQDASALHLRVLLLSLEMSEKKIKAARLGDSVVGLAHRATRRAHIFYPRIADLAIMKGCVLSDLLGHVLAHEVGHLMLGGRHSDRGIMQADLELRRGASPRFTDAQITCTRSS
jgi:hypothetical protein